MRVGREAGVRGVDSPSRSRRSHTVCKDHGGNDNTWGGVWFLGTCFSRRFSQASTTHIVIAAVLHIHIREGPSDTSILNGMDPPYL